MPSRYNSYFSQRKISQGKTSANPAPGGGGKVNEKTAAWPGLPGKASAWYKVGGTKVKQHPKSEGLC